MRAALAVVLGLLPLVVGVAQAFKPAVAPPSITTSVVRVDAFTSDARGRAVENLKPSDFALTENGESQAIDDVRFVRDDGRDAAEQAVAVRSEFDEQVEAARGGPRLFAIYLDEYHVSPGASTDRAREALTRFVDQDLGPGDLVAVLKPLDSLLTIRLTRNRDLVRHEIESFEGRRGLYAPRNAFERNYIAGAPARIDQVRAQVATSALNALVVHLGALRDGRKSVLFVSEGMAGVSRRRGLEGLPSVDTVIRSANRYNVSIYPVDPASPEKGESESDGDVGEKQTRERETLRSLAEGTDGRATLDAGTPDDLGRAMQQMVSDASAYYLLTYRSSHADDGKFREVQVKVTRPGVRVRARKGYWALWPDEALAKELLAKVNAPSAAPPPPPGFALPWRTSNLIRPWFGIARGENGKTRVTFVWEPAPRVPGDRARTVASPARVQLTALAPDGTQVFKGEVCGPALQICDSSRAVFDVPPGRLRLRMAIEDAASQEIDADVREISIRDLKGPVALGSAEIVRTRTARDFHEASTDAAIAGAASREFSRTERLIVRFPAYAPDGAPHVSVRLINRIGQTMRTLDVERSSIGDGRYQFDLPLASFAPGEYYFELTASSGAGEAKDLIGFRVTN